MATRFPYRGVHKDACIDTNDIVMKQYHAFPPVLFNIVFQLNTILTIVINGCKSVINLTAWEDETILFTMAYYLLENIFLCHNNLLFNYTINIVKRLGFYYFFIFVEG